jgi:hypothetical protein
MSHTYTETILRFRVVVHEELPEEHKAQYRLHGIDPDNNWRLIWSFHDLADAEAQLAIENERKASFQTWKIVDAGQAETIERQAWF